MERSVLVWERLDGETKKTSSMALPFKLVHGGHVVGFDEWAAAAWTGELRAAVGDVVVASAV